MHLFHKVASSLYLRSLLKHSRMSLFQRLANLLYPDRPDKTVKMQRMQRMQRMGEFLLDHVKNVRISQSLKGQGGAAPLTAGRRGMHGVFWPECETAILN